MSNTSLWEAISIRNTPYPILENDLEVDVAIIGGGITGITAANQLVSTGKKVVILEANTLGGGTTGNSTGNLYVAIEPYYQTVEATFNFETAKTIAYSRKAAIDYIEKNVKEKDIDCHFTRRPWYAYTTKEAKKLEREVELFNKMGMPIEYTDNMPLDIKFKKAAVMQDQARFNPLQYVIAMAADLAKKGCLIFENTPVIEIVETEHGILKTAHATITAKKILIATHTPVGINSTQMFTAPYRSYVVAVKLENCPEGHFWDVSGISPSICTHAMSQNHPELLMVAGNHHKTGQGSDLMQNFEKHEAFLRKNFNTKDVAFQWSAQHYQSADSAPYIGLNGSAQHTYIASGFWADGLTYGTLAGIIVGDLILGKNNPLSATYQPDRKKMMTSMPFVLKENANVLLQYLKDYPLISLQNFDDIKPGEGKVIEINREKCAVSRDDNNLLHVVSAVCTHMKCIVNWNDAEKTWDCPCHGSRFTCKGKVIEGPAILDLEIKPEHPK